MRVRFTFAKTEAMRYTGHLDLFRSLERTMRRARLPLAYSEGFRPHPKINVAAALPLGIVSDEELGEFWLKETLRLEDIEAQLKEATPPGIGFQTFEEIVGRVPKLQTQTHSADYRVALLEEDIDIEPRVAELMAQNEIMLERKKKGKVRSYDLRPLILNMEVVDGDIHMQLALREGATGRADEVLKALNVENHQASITRTKIHLLPGE